MCAWTRRKCPVDKREIHPLSVFVGNIPLLSCQENKRNSPNFEPNLPSFGWYFERPGTLKTSGLLSYVGNLFITCHPIVPFLLGSYAVDRKQWPYVCAKYGSLTEETRNRAPSHRVATSFTREYMRTSSPGPQGIRFMLFRPKKGGRNQLAGVHSQVLARQMLLADEAPLGREERILLAHGLPLSPTQPMVGFRTARASDSSCLDRQFCFILFWFPCTLPPKPATVTEQQQQLGYLGGVEKLGP